MASSEQLASFIGSSFRSVWAVELLLLLKQEGRACSIDEIISLMRASPSVVDKALDGLIAAGLADVDDGQARYMPVNAEVAALVEETEQLYRSKPDRVRRVIIMSSSKGLTAFSDAFRLKD